MAQKISLASHPSAATADWPEHMPRPEPVLPPR